MNEEYVAHIRKFDNEKQTVATHLTEVGQFAGDFADKINSGDAGQLMGLLHDFGKYSQQFQSYIKSAGKLIGYDDDMYVDASGLKGKVDHSTAGAQWLFSLVKPIMSSGLNASQRDSVQLVLQSIAMAIVSHHSGLIDSLQSPKYGGFCERIKKSADKTHWQECLAKCDPQILAKVKQRVSADNLIELSGFVNRIQQTQQGQFAISPQQQAFYLGFYCRFLFSCLIDADRISSADFENEANKVHRRNTKPAEKTDWSLVVTRVEQFVSQLNTNGPINAYRAKISEECRLRAQDPQGIYSLTVPTGGGKTYASFRYGVAHAAKHQLDRIIYVIPYTSIIEQNAKCIREMLGDDIADQWVLEHHSNLEPERQTWRSKLTSENWDAPIIFTTMVQLLETLFSGGTRGVRRLHQLARSVLIFDEIQTLPIKCVHLFCNSINFLSHFCQTTALMCTATQPLLHHLTHPRLGQLHLPATNEIMTDVGQLADLFKRVAVIHLAANQPADTAQNSSASPLWTVAMVAQLACDSVAAQGSCLVVVNTKKWAKNLFLACQAHPQSPQKVFHLSTLQCSAHRKNALNEIRASLTNGEPILCISTQLIEAGVDVSFHSVIRFKAGLDAIAQAAGRCNRHGELQGLAPVYVIDPADEDLSWSADLQAGKQAVERIFREYPAAEYLTPKAIARYFEYYFHQRAGQMVYPVSGQTTGLDSDTSILELLSLNRELNQGDISAKTVLVQAFMSAGKAFEVIDAPTQSLLVRYGHGDDLITELCAASKSFEPELYYQLLKSLQPYSVNLYPNMWRKLVEASGLIEICDERGEGQGIFYLADGFYSEQFGVADQRVSDMPFLSC